MGTARTSVPRFAQNWHGFWTPKGHRTRGRRRQEHRPPDFGYVRFGAGGGGTRRVPSGACQQVAGQAADRLPSWCACISAVWEDLGAFDRPLPNMHLSRRAALVVALVTFAAAGQEAQAGTATSRNGCAAEGRVCGSETVYRADPGEPNDVTVTSEAGAFVIVDLGGVVQSAGTCVSLDAHRARCPNGFTGPSGGGDRLVLRLGDLDDRVNAGTGASVHGDAGNDTLTATRLSSLYGGEGADVLTGSEDPDALDGGMGSDVIDGNGPAASTPYAGDTVIYSDRVRPVRVDLSQGIGGEASEADAVTEVEHVTSGHGDDVLIGDGGPNNLDGGGGRDLLQGGDGHDLLQGRAGNDRLEGGMGDDTLWGEGGANELGGGGGNDQLFPGESSRLRSRASCGPGRDEIGPTAPATLIAAGCEQVRLGPDLRVPRVPTIGQRQAVFRRAFCYRDPCPIGTLNAIIAGRRIGTGRTQRDGRIVIRYNARGRRLLGRAQQRRLVRLVWRERGETLSSGYSTVWKQDGAPPWRRQQQARRSCPLSGATRTGCEFQTRLCRGHPPLRNPPNRVDPAQPGAKILRKCRCTIECE